MVTINKPANNTPQLNFIKCISIIGISTLDFTSDPIVTFPTCNETYSFLFWPCFALFEQICSKLIRFKSE